MSQKFIYALMILFSALIFAACNAVDTKVNSQANNASNASQPALPAQHADDGVRRVTTSELEELVKQGKAIVVDVRNKASYDAGHIKGAKWISVTEILNRTGELPRDKMIVTYCS
jgi:3-mercaptopyruvate sulfurtransferase SseA